jgi:hypothetical protein
MIIISAHENFKKKTLKNFLKPFGTKRKFDGKGQFSLFFPKSENRK